MIITAFTCLAYPVVIQFKRGGWRRVVMALPAVAVFVSDILANYTELAWVFGWPDKGDHTITARFKRMHNDPLESRRQLAKLVQIYLDACEHDGKH